MQLDEFLAQTLAQVETTIGERMVDEGPYPHAESVFAEIVMEHMAEVGMTSDPEVCHFATKVKSANLRLSGWALSDDNEQLDLFVCLYDGKPEVRSIADSETKTAAEQCLRFLSSCVEGKLAAKIEESNDAYTLAVVLPEVYPALEQIRIYVLTDRQAKSKNFKAIELAGKTVKLEVMDIERLHRHWSEGKPRDELVVNFEEVCGAPLPCVYVPGEASGYDYALTAVPGEALRFIYEKFDSRLLEANVRSFLSTTSKVNKGIRDTLRKEPERFMAYNNGVVLVADEVRLSRSSDGSPGIAWMRGLQIVNGGQTTASIYFTKKKEPSVDLSRVRVPAKVIVLRNSDPDKEEALISDISRFANSQSAVKQSDLSANKPFHVEIERLSNATYCPDGVCRWFYERAAGSYSTMLALEGTTPAKLQKIKAAVPTSRKISKTDLAKYLNAWDQLPHVVSLGSQKNFDQFMCGLADSEGEQARPLPNTQVYKEMIAKAIIYKKTSALIRPMFAAFQANVAAYTVALLSRQLGTTLDLMRIWQQQDMSSPLRAHMQGLATQVHKALHDSADGRMISEWAKKPACWASLSSLEPLAAPATIPEIR